MKYFKNVKIIKEGFLIPEEVLKKLGLGEFEIDLKEKEHEILVRPKTATKDYKGFVGAKKFDEKFLKSLEHEWAKRGEIGTI